MEYNHMDELGFTEDKQLLCTVSGLLGSGNAVKRLCDRFIRNGGRLYDILTAYDNIMAFELGREDRSSGDAFKTMIPLLRASGATDSSVYDHFVKDMSILPGSEVIHYLNGLMTTQLISEAYEHHSMALCDSLGITYDNIRSTEVSFDELELSRQDAKRFRDIASEMPRMDVPKISSDGSMRYIDHKDQAILDSIDGMIKRIEDTEFSDQLVGMNPMGGNTKAFALMDMRMATNVDSCCTAYIGNNGTDYPAMDVIRDNDGLSIAFNGDGYAIKGSNVAVMSPNPIVAAVLVSEFYTGGLEGVFSLIGSWDRDKLSKREHSDRHLIGALLRTFPSKLPDVVIVDEDNIEDITRESERYRRKLTT